MCRVHFSSQTEICDLDGVERWSAWRCDQGGVPPECCTCVLRRGSGDKDILWLDITVEEVVRMYVVQTGKNLEENTLHAAGVEAFVVSRFHKLIEVAVHIFHANV